MSILSSHGLVVERGFQIFSPVRTRLFGILHNADEGTGFPKKIHLSDQALLGVLHAADRGNRVKPKNFHLSDQGISAFSMKPIEETGFPNNSHLSDQGLSAFFMKQTEKTGFPNIFTCPIRAFSAFSTKPASPFILTSLRIWKAVSPLQNGRMLNKKKSQHNQNVEEIPNLLYT
jgi:hypothetical protein